MSERNDSWDPADGPPPSDDEREDAKSLSEALSGGARGEIDADTGALLDVARRIRATAHPDAEATRAVARAAVDYALTRSGQRWYRRRWTWLAAAAVVIVGAGGLQLAALRVPDGESALPISHPASDVYNQPLPSEPRSAPIGQLADVRMRSYRDALLFGGGRRER